MQKIKAYFIICAILLFLIIFIILLALNSDVQNNENSENIALNPISSKNKNSKNTAENESNDKSMNENAAKVKNLHSHGLKDTSDTLNRNDKNSNKKQVDINLIKNSNAHIFDNEKLDKTADNIENDKVCPELNKELADTDLQINKGLKKNGTKNIKEQNIPTYIDKNSLFKVSSRITDIDHQNNANFSYIKNEGDLSYLNVLLECLRTQDFYFKKLILHVKTLPEAAKILKLPIINIIYKLYFESDSPKLKSLASELQLFTLYGTTFNMNYSPNTVLPLLLHQLLKEVNEIHAVNINTEYNAIDSFKKTFWGKLHIKNEKAVKQDYIPYLYNHIPDGDIKTILKNNVKNIKSLNSYEGYNQDLNLLVCEQAPQLLIIPINRMHNKAALEMPINICKNLSLTFSTDKIGEYTYKLNSVITKLDNTKFKSHQCVCYCLRNNFWYLIDSINKTIKKMDEKKMDEVLMKNTNSIMVFYELQNK